MARGSGSRLSADAWIDGTLDLLRSEGLAAITINRLCESLGVTRGSFYWHFADLDALREAVTDRWCDETRAALAAMSELNGLPPRERIRAMTMRLVDPDSAVVERALREWGRTDERVASVIAEADLFIFGTVHGALVELGHSPDDARVIGGMLVYAGIGFAQGGHGLPAPTPAEIERLLSLFL